jgi:hypothetical protein
MTNAFYPTVDQRVDVVVHAALLICASGSTQPTDFDRGAMEKPAVIIWLRYRVASPEPGRQGETAWFSPV